MPTERSVRERERYQSDPEYRAKVRAYQNDYLRKRRQDPEFRERERLRRNADTARRYRFKTDYGITLEDYDQMLADQGGVCAVCATPPKGKRRLDVDHCHDTGRVRGLLCNPCNVSLGLLGEDSERISKLLNYLETSCADDPR